MPQTFRLPTRMTCEVGLDLVHPVDRMPVGAYSYLYNVRVLQEGRIEGRPGYTEYLSLAGGDIPNSVRRLNDPSHVYAAGGYIYVGGGGSSLYAGPVGSYTAVDTGYTSNPLSLIPNRPDQAPESWMYVYDGNKNVKVRPDKTVRDVGVTPPGIPPTTEYAAPAFANAADGQDGTGYTASGTTSGAATGDRTNGGCTISQIFYNNSPAVGWACLVPSSTDTSWMGDRMEVNLGGTEDVVVREVHGAIQPTTVLGIQYDAGSTGLCSIVLTDARPEIQRNSIIIVGGEYVRVYAVVPSQSGLGNPCIRCTLVGTHAAGEAVTGAVSWYVYTVGTHVNGEAVTSNYVLATHTVGEGSISKAISVDAATAFGRAIQTADDYVHIALYIENPSVVSSLRVMITFDATPVFDLNNPGNCLMWTFDQSNLIPQSSAASWYDVVMPISQGTRFGNDPAVGIGTITGVALSMISTDDCDYGYDWIYFFGTYGQVIQPNSPVGVIYCYRYRDSSTGAKSVPGPFTEYDLFPLREGVTVLPTSSTQTGVDTIDIYRVGGDVPDPLYVGSSVNTTPPTTFTDGIPDDTVLAVNQPPDLGAIKPWPILQLPLSGTCNLVGTSLVITGGDNLSTFLLNNTVVLIEGAAFLIRGAPKTVTTAQVTQCGGVKTGVPFLIASPTFYGQPLPLAIGLEGPFDPVVFALGDVLNGGTLYFSNFGDMDGASDQNTLELCTPSNNLVGGASWNGMVFVGSRSDVFCVRYSFLAGGGVSYQWFKINAKSGMWSRWTVCAGPDGVYYLGRDGVYKATDIGAVNITDETLYPLFPHDGEPAPDPSVPLSGMYPVDMSAI